MASKRKPTRRAAPAELPAEVRLRRERALFQAAQYKAARTAMLATYQAADRGRRNKDWRPPKGSADLAIIPDADTLNARSRQMVRDSQIAKSIVKAFTRNVVGTGITPVPTVKGPDGRMLKEVNRFLMRLFWAWAQDYRWCDVEERQTYWEKQSLTLKEWTTVGEHFIVWNYERHPTKVGLRLQSFEPEQLDTTLTSYLDPATGERREVRGGVEVNDRGAARAYHFYQRNPNDYVGSRGVQSVRVPAHRVHHFFEQDRVLQTRGVTPLAPVLQQIRDYDQFDNAHLMRARLEACIGAIVKTTAGNAGNGPLMVPAATGDDRTTASGMTELDFVPGMVPHLAPGEEVEPFIPSSPGNQYEPFTKAKVRGIGAGVGLSYGQVARQSESNYSAARQDMLEDRKEFEPLQEWLAHKQVLPIYGLFVTLAVMEGRLDGLAEFDADDFALNPERYQQVEYVAPAPPWIDPEKEINAYEKAIKLRVMDRTEVVATTSGRRLEDVWGNIESENADAAEKGIALPEVVDAKLVDADATQKYADAKSKLTPPPVVADGPDPELERMRAEADVYGVAVRAGEVTPQVEDEEAFRQRHGLPPMSEAARAAWAKGGNVRQPITLAPPGADASPGVSNQGEQPVDAPPPTEKGDRGEDDDENDEAATAKEGLHAKSLAELAAAVDRPPNYRLSMVPETRCDGCRHFAVGMCTAYNATVSPDHLCDAFETPPVTDGDGAGTIQPPPLQDGEVPIDNVTAGGFAPDARLAAKAVYDSSSTQVEVPEPLRSTVMELGRQLIPDDLLYRDDSEYGRETEPHVTVLYGLETGDVGPVKAVMADAGRATVTLGRVGVFSREDKPFDVVFAEVHSPDLVKLNKVLSGLPHRNDYPEYHPHMTIAYVDKGHGSRFEGREEFVGLLFTADAITFSSNSGRRTSIPLNPK